MTTLTLYAESAPSQALLRTRDGAAITQHLNQLGVRFERWPIRPLPEGADAATVLATYAPEVRQLQQERGYLSVDVAGITPDHPERAAMRQKFIEEHTHADDEVRFFVQGQGAFYLHLGDRVHQVVCEAGDLISVPAGTRHWFDMGPSPRFTAIRLFRSPDGWVGHFTGDPLSAAVPRLEADGEVPAHAA
ncbi:MAG: cupin domain-containing protein [Curvibacter sp.]|nr:cupin domain-containing protein [Curvibacter sp.]